MLLRSIKEENNPDRLDGYNSSDWKAIDNHKNWSTIDEFQKMCWN